MSLSHLEDSFFSQIELICFVTLSNRGLHCNKRRGKVRDCSSSPHNHTKSQNKIYNSWILYIAEQNIEVLLRVFLRFPLSHFHRHRSAPTLKPLTDGRMTLIMATVQRSSENPVSWYSCARSVPYNPPNTVSQKVYPLLPQPSNLKKNCIHMNARIQTVPSRILKYTEMGDVIQTP